MFQCLKSRWQESQLNVNHPGNSCDQTEREVLHPLYEANIQNLESSVKIEVSALGV